MERIESAVLDAGPIIHLSEIKQISIFGIISRKYITPEVKDETRGIILRGIIVKLVEGINKDYAKLLIEREEIDLGEATSIALCRQEGIKKFFTDDLDARDVAKREGLNPHGSLSLVLRCFRESILSRQEALSAVDNLHKHSSLYLTADLVSYIQKEIEKFDRQIRPKGK